MNKIQKVAPIILSVTSSVGLITTSILVAKESTKNVEAIKKAKESGSKKELIKTFLKCYWPAICAGTATVASITAGTIISKKTEASLTATCIALDKSLTKYKNKVKEYLGDDASSIEEEIAKDDISKLDEPEKKVHNGNVLYWEEHIGLFEVNPEKFEAAIGRMNEEIIYRKGWSSIKKLIKYSSAILKDKDFIDADSYDYGWCQSYLNELSTVFLHYKKEAHYNSEGELEYYIIRWDADPIFNAEGYFKNYCFGNTIKEIIDLENYGSTMDIQDDEDYDDETNLKGEE